MFAEPVGSFNTEFKFGGAGQWGCSWLLCQATDAPSFTEGRAAQKLGNAPAVEGLRASASVAYPQGF